MKQPEKIRINNIIPTKTLLSSLAAGTAAAAAATAVACLAVQVRARGNKHLWGVVCHPETNWSR